MPLTGEAKREYQRVYARSRRHEALRQAAATAVAMTGVRVDGQRDRRFKEGLDVVEDTARATLALACREYGLTPEKLVGKLVQKLEATTMKTVAQEACEVQDNDAQLRAVAEGRDLLARAGLIPTPIQHGPAGGHITLNVLVMAADGTEQIRDVTVREVEHEPTP